MAPGLTRSPFIRSALPQFPHSSINPLCRYTLQTISLSWTRAWTHTMHTQSTHAQSTHTRTRRVRRARTRTHTCLLPSFRRSSSHQLLPHVRLRVPLKVSRLFKPTRPWMSTQTRGRGRHTEGQQRAKPASREGNWAEVVWVRRLEYRVTSSRTEMMLRWPKFSTRLACARFC